MPKLSNESVLFLVVIVALVINSLTFGYAVYLDVSKLDVPEKHKAFLIGLATLFTFVAGFLLMYAEHKGRVMLIDIYSDVVNREFNKVIEKLRECVNECPCAADPYLRLRLAEVYVRKINEKV
jgi:ABC-type transport system involved in multi-copper enzyme maturation permease subunit